MLQFWIQDNTLIVDVDGRPILCEECPCAEPSGSSSASGSSASGGSASGPSGSSSVGSGASTDCGFMAQETFARLQVPEISVDVVIEMIWSPDQWDGDTVVTNECDTVVTASVTCTGIDWALLFGDRIGDTQYTPPENEDADEITWEITFHESTCSGGGGGGDYSGTFTIRKDGTNPWT